MKVTLKFAHKHAGVDYPAGATIDVPVVDALWLKSEDVIEEAVADIKAELKKLATKEDPNPHAGLLAKAVASEDAANKLNAITGTTAAPAAPPAPGADTATK
jgi:hypothetical protein